MSKVKDAGAGSTRSLGGADSDGGVQGARGFLNQRLKGQTRNRSNGNHGNHGIHGERQRIF